jgi:hypothetical protein
MAGATQHCGQGVPRGIAVELAVTACWYPPVSTYDYAMTAEEVLRLACCFQPDEVCS